MTDEERILNEFEAMTTAEWFYNRADKDYMEVTKNRDGYDYYDGWREFKERQEKLVEYEAATRVYLMHIMRKYI